MAAADALATPARSLSADEAVSLTVSGRFAHFRRIEGTKPRTYSVIPRTTVSGFLAAIVGRGRDEYYDIFRPERTRVAVTLDHLGGRYVMAEKHVGTRKEEQELTSTDYRRSEAEQALTKVMGSLPREKAIYGNRQRPIRHMLRDVQYTIDVVFDSDNDRVREFRDDLVSHLAKGTSVYTPSLGTAECLASIEGNGPDRDGRVQIESIDDTAPSVDSALPLSVVNAAESGVFDVEKHPYQMTATDTGRRNDGTLSMAHSEEPLVATEDCGFAIGDRAVAFC